jgi:hypothetical protein
LEVLITGKGGKSGAWAIRGRQLGDAIGAKVTPMATLDDCQRADVIVVVKRPVPAVIEAIRKSGKPWVLDIVDGWPQPSMIDRLGAMKWIRQWLEFWRPDGAVFGTQTMLEDSEFTGPSLVLPHHSWPKYQRNQIRNEVSVVGYEGAVHYLGKWLPAVAKACQTRGWDFIVNCDMTQTDIGIALRDNGGYPAACWKPGTKLSNLHALGIPALCSPEQGYREVASGAEFWIHKESDINDAFDAMTHENRLDIADKMHSAKIELPVVAGIYKHWLGYFQ